MRGLSGVTRRDSNDFCALLLPDTNNISRIDDWKDHFENLRGDQALQKIVIENSIILGESVSVGGV